MKVVHVSYSDSSGGAAIAALRHHFALREAGIDSKMLVLDRRNGDSSIVKIDSKISVFLRKVFYKIFKILFKPYGTWSYSVLGNRLSRNPVIKEADVIIFHWVNSWFLSVKDIGRILSSGKKVFWFMHDMWPITGGCHHAMDCDKYKDLCFSCPMIRGLKIPDIARIQFDKKMKDWVGVEKLHTITPSRWLADRIKESRLMGNCPVSVVRNKIDTGKFDIRNKQEARMRLGLPLDKKLVLFGAETISSPYKGWKYIDEILKRNHEGVEFVIYGGLKNKLPNYVSKVHNMGRISDLDKLVDLYNAADVFITPTLADNYPNVIVEAQACGLPTVSFPTGGVVEMIVDGINGCLTKEKTVDSMLEGIEKVLNDKISSREKIRELLLEEQKKYDLANLIQLV